MRGKILKSGTRSRGSAGSNGGQRNQDKWKKERSEDQDGGRRSGRSSTASGMGSQSRYGNSRAHSGSECTEKEEDEVIDTATSPSKPRWSSSKGGYGNTKLANKIRHQKLAEEKARKAREEAFDAGLIGPGGVISAETENVVLHELQEQGDDRIDSYVPKAAGQGFDLNFEPNAPDGMECSKTDMGEQVEEQGNGDGDGNTAKDWDDDPFELVPIIEAGMIEQNRKKRNFQELVQTDCNLSVEPKQTKARKTLVLEAEETSQMGSPNEK